MKLRNLWIKIISKWRILLVILVPALIVYTLIIMLSLSSINTNNGNADLEGFDFSNNKVVALTGQWEFYWDRFLAPEEFSSGQKPQPDSFMKVPGVWSQNKGTNYSGEGFATYRLSLSYPKTLKDPALSIRQVANAYKLYVNGQLAAEVGGSLNDKKNFKHDDQIVIINLPKDSQKIDLVFQVSNLSCATGGLRSAPVFGSYQALEYQRMKMLILQLIFIGGVLIFSFHYFFLFLLQRKNKTALIFAIFCLITAMRSMGWGEMPISLLFPHVSIYFKMYLNYFTGYNYVAVFILFVHSIYPVEYKKTLVFLLIPSIILDIMLMINSPDYMTYYTNFLYILLLVQMIYVLFVLIKSVFKKRDNAILMFIAICSLIWAMNVDIINFVVIGNTNLSFMSLFGNFAVILAMSYIQARQQSTDHKKLILYNESLLETDRLKDQIMATEMSFLQAQIKPHFLYNALSAIANVCENDRKQAGKLIIDLAIYLRSSLEFNNLDKMATIEKELEFVDTYFHIEQARFGQKIRLQKKIEIPLNVRIPVLIVQPLVENAVRHGISKKTGGGTVTLIMERRDKNIYIEIKDDGVGISNEKLTSILSGNNEGKGVGLLNIHNRLLKLYGTGLEIRSEPEQTSVKFMIPEVDND